MDSQAIIKALKADGWVQVVQQGRHVRFKHPTKPGRVTVPYPKKDIPSGTLRSIEKQSGLKQSELHAAVYCSYPQGSR